MAGKKKRITFFSWLVPLVTTGLKNVTIRDEREAHNYERNDLVDVFPLERAHSTAVCEICIASVEPLPSVDDVTEEHARQECLGLEELRQLLRQVYPNDHENLFVIRYKLTKVSLIQTLLGWWRVILFKFERLWSNITSWWLRCHRGDDLVLPEFIFWIPLHQVCTTRRRSHVPKVD